MKCNPIQHIYSPFSCGCGHDKHRLSLLQSVTAVALSALGLVASGGNPIVGAVVFYVTTGLMKLANNPMPASGRGGVVYGTPHYTPPVHKVRRRNQAPIVVASAPAYGHSPALTAVTPGGRVVPGATPHMAASAPSYRHSPALTAVTPGGRVVPETTPHMAASAPAYRHSPAATTVTPGGRVVPGATPHMAASAPARRPEITVVTPARSQESHSRRDVPVRGSFVTDDDRRSGRVRTGD